MNHIKHYENRVKKLKSLFIKMFDNNEEITLYHVECLFVIIDELIEHVKELEDIKRS